MNKKFVLIAVGMIVVCLGAAVIYALLRDRTSYCDELAAQKGYKPHLPQCDFGEYSLYWEEIMPEIEFLKVCKKGKGFIKIDGYYSPDGLKRRIEENIKTGSVKTDDVCEQVGLTLSDRNNVLIRLR